jgi:CzcA family heavy metal efflux pump
MWQILLRWSLDNRWGVLALAAVVLGWGTWTSLRLPVDVLPDVNAPTVTILTESHGMAPDEVESLVTIPLESALNGTAGLRRLRSSSGVGLSIVWVEFDWDTDPYRARQVVNERLQAVRTSLPDDIAPPVLAPMSSIMGEILFLGLTADARIDPMALRDYGEWELRRRLLSVPGVAQVTTMGGELRQVQVIIDPARLQQSGVGLRQVLHAVEDASINAPGGIVVSRQSEYLVRALGRAPSLEELGLVVVGRARGAPVLLRQVADLRFGPTPPRGTAAIDGNPAVVLAVQKQPEANTLELTANIDVILDDVETSLPPGMSLHRKGFRQARFIDTAIGNVQRHLFESALLVAILLTLFLANWRTTLISLMALPLSILAGVLTLAALNAGINTMTLGGFAIAIGALVDDAVIFVENIYRRLRLRAALPEAERPPLTETVYAASREIQSSVVYATAIIVVVFLPLFFFSGLEGRLLEPLGLAYIASIVASLLVAFTVTPALCALLLREVRAFEEQPEAWLARGVKTLYRPGLEAALSHPRSVLAGSLIGVLIALALMAQFGRSFLPPFNEGAFTLAAATAPGTPLQTSDSLMQRLEGRLMDLSFVESAVRRTGRAELDEHAQDVNFSEIEVTVTEGTDLAEASAEIRRAATQVPGLVVSVGQPIGHRIEHMLSGVKTSLAVKVFGHDLAELRRVAAQVHEAIHDVPGVVDLAVEQQTDVPQILVRPFHAALAQFGMTPGELAEWTETALEGHPVGEWWMGGRSFDIVVRYPDSFRAGVEAMRLMPIDVEGERFTSLGQVARIDKGLGPNLIQRENGKRRIVVLANLQDRDVGSAVAEMRRHIRDEVEFPDGFYVEFGGQAASAQQAARTLSMLSVFAILCMFALLWSALGSPRDAALVMSNLPLALIGGVLVVLGAHGILSIASLVGFITLFGIATRNGILLVTHYHHLMDEEGASLHEAVRRGSEERLVPILMTAVGTALALVPIALAAGEPGNEIQAPMAAVILGGLLSSTALVLVVLPVLFARFGRP